MADPHIQTEPTASRAAGRMSLKAMVVSLLVILLGVGGGLFYLLVGPILAEERFIRMLEGMGAKIERRTDPPEEISDWVRKQLGFPAAVRSYEGPLAWDREEDDLAGMTFRRLESFSEIPPGETKTGSSLDLAYFTMSAFHFVSDIEDDRLRWLGSLQKISDLNINASKLSGDFLTRLNRTNLYSLTLRGANTNRTWAEGLRACGQLSILSITDSKLDPETAGVIFGMDTLTGLSLEKTEIRWPVTLDASKSRIKDVFLTKMKKDRRLMSELGRLPALDSLLIWHTSIEPGYFSGLEDAIKLEALVIFYGSVRGDAFASLKGNQSILRLTILKADLDPEAIQGLAAMSSLQSLYIGGQNVDDRVVAHLLTLPPLENLTLSPSELTDAGFEELIRQGNIQSLDIIETKVTARGLEALLEPQPLKELWLDDGMITPKLKQWIRMANPQLKLEIQDAADEEVEESDP